MRKREPIGGLVKVRPDDCPAFLFSGTGKLQPSGAANPFIVQAGGAIPGRRFPRHWPAVALHCAAFNILEILVGKGDRRTRRGKIYAGSFGKLRPKDPKAGKKPAARPAAKPAEAAKPAAKPAARRAKSS